MAASHLVAHDALRRGPRERAQMLRRIGIRKIVWDWRDEHLGAFDAELDALRQYEVELSGIWTPLPMPAYEEPDYATRFGLVPTAIKTLITEAEAGGVVGLLIRRHGKRRPDARQLDFVLAKRVEFGVEGAQVLVAPVPHDLADADASQHLGALTGAATSCVVSNQVACRHLITLAPVRN